MGSNCEVEGQCVPNPALSFADHQIALRVNHHGCARNNPHLRECRKRSLHLLTAVSFFRDAEGFAGAWSSATIVRAPGDDGLNEDLIVVQYGEARAACARSRVWLIKHSAFVLSVCLIVLLYQMLDTDGTLLDETVLLARCASAAVSVVVALRLLSNRLQAPPRAACEHLARHDSGCRPCRGRLFQ